MTRSAKQAQSPNRRPMLRLDEAIGAPMLSYLLTIFHVGSECQHVKSSRWRVFEISGGFPTRMCEPW